MATATRCIITTAKQVFLLGIETVEAERIARGTPVETEGLRRSLGLPPRRTSQGDVTDSQEEAKRTLSSPVLGRDTGKQAVEDLLANVSTSDDENVPSQNAPTATGGTLAHARARVDKSRAVATLGRPSKALPTEAVRKLADEGLGSKAIATRLKDAGIEVSYKTIQRLLAGQGENVRAVTETTIYMTLLRNEDGNG